jgi:long-chain acyl-CoA synthetase
MSRWDPLRALQLIEREKATVWIGVPTMIQDMMEHPDFDRYDTSSLAAVGSGGGPTPKSQVAKAASKFKNAGGNGIHNGYGLTETSGAVSFVMGEMYQQKPTTIGPPCLIAEIQVRNVDTGAVVGPNESGELFIKSPLVMKGYYNKPDKTAEVLDKDGWFASGDIGMLDEDGFAYILDRAKDLIIRGGENISCAEVEAAFIGTGNVMECAAVGIPDDRLGEIVGLMVVRSSAGKDVTAKQLREQVVGNIAGFKIPDEAFIFFSEGKLPRGATEKIQKRDIRDSLVAQLGRARSKL